MTQKHEAVKYQKDNEVIKNNALIRCRNKLTTVQRKSFAVMLHRTLEDIKALGENKYYAMPLTEYRAYMGHPDNMPTKYISKELEALMTKIVEWNLDDEGYGTRSVMLSGFEMEKGSGIIKWAFSPFLVDKILEDGYTPLKLSVILDFASSYALALYENLQMYKSFKKISFNLQEFRALMGVEKDEHLRMEAFKRKVLTPALAEINAKSDMKVYCEDDKQGVKIVGFRFMWENLTNEQLKERNKRKEKEEAYLEALKNRIGEKYEIGGKKYTLTKDGLVYRGKVFFDLIDSYDMLSKLKQEGLI